MKPRAVVLLSGGLDSATALYWAKAQGYATLALTVRYGQRHAREARSAKAIARATKSAHFEIDMKLPWLKTSSLVDSKRALPDIPLESIGRGGVPSTYVPGRNTLFLALGVSLADAEGAAAVIIGANALDYSGYPDCRPDFLRAFEGVAAKGTRSGDEGRHIKVIAPLLRLDKAEIVQLALSLRVPMERTWSCYAGGKVPCRRCDSCKLRAKGFAEAAIADPAPR